VIFGKTNVPMWTADSQSYNEIFGATSNPWDVRRTPGGSSGGAAAALAAGQCALELGSDIAGSIRGPAHCSGVAGLRPSFGLVPQEGYIDGPTGWDTDTDMSAIGPLGRAVDDLELGLDVIAGPRGSEATAWRLELPPARALSLEDYRIAVTLDDPYCPISRDSLAVLRRAVDALADSSARLEERALPVALPEADDLFSRLLAAATCARPSDEDFADLQRICERSGADDDAIDVRRARAFTQTHRAWHAACEQRARMRARWAEFFQQYDALICPVTLTVAAPHRDAGGTTGRMVLASDVDGRRRHGWEEIVWATLSSVGALPAVSIPVGRGRDGLPVGMQIIGPYLEDRTLLDVARHVERVAGGFQRPPGP
jgi:amidase